MSAIDRSVVFPSPVTTVDVSIRTERYPILIPSRETWRVRDLFERHEYGGIPPGTLRSCPIILDVGANVGVFTAYAWLVHRPCTLHCFEPAPATLDLLRQNTARFPFVSVHPFALGRADSVTDLYLDPANSGANSLKPDHVRNPAGKISVRVRDAAAVWDELGLGEVDLLKIDIEGSEVDVLETLGPRMDRVRVVMVEYHTPNDRRRIDALLPRHLLFGAVVHSLRVGVVKYVRDDLNIAGPSPRL